MIIYETINNNKYNNMVEMKYNYNKYKKINIYKFKMKKKSHIPKVTKKKIKKHQKSH